MATRDVVNAADQIQLYKFLCRQVARSMGLTASFLPKPVVGVNGSGMHTNVSVSKGKKNLFWDPKGEEKISKFALEFCGPHSQPRQRYLPRAESERQCLSPSRPAFRSAEPDSSLRRWTAAPWCAFRSATRRSSRVEVRAVAPDANPYMVLYSIFKTGIDGAIAEYPQSAQRQTLSCRITSTTPWKISARRSGRQELFSEEVKDRYLDLKKASADRCPRLLGHHGEGDRRSSSTTRSITSTSGTIFRKKAQSENEPRPKGRGFLSLPRQPAAPNGAGPCHLCNDARRSPHLSARLWDRQSSNAQWRPSWRAAGRELHRACQRNMRASSGISQSSAALPRDTFCSRWSSSARRRDLSSYPSRAPDLGIDHVDRRARSISHDLIEDIAELGFVFVA